MTHTDTSEKGLESLIVHHLTSHSWLAGDPKDYDRVFAVDLAQLKAFLTETQDKVASELGLEEDGATRQRFLSRLQGEVTRRGVVDVLRRGIKHEHLDVTLFFGTPSPGNTQATEQFAKNRFSVTRQLRFSPDEQALALDIALFVNGLPVATFELKNSLTKQTADDAIEQYRRDRDPRERLFEAGRCMVHLAVDDSQVFFCTQLKGKDSWFLPFNQGWNDGAGNPPNPEGLKTDYLWKDVLTPTSLTNILENYAQTVEESDRKGRKKQKQIFPRFHQLDVVRKLLRATEEEGAGHRYLIQHSAGSGKSNSIAWLAHQLIDVQRNGASAFDSIVVVTDRRILDKQIKDTIKQFAQVSATVGHAERSDDLRKFLAGGKKIIITTIQKFPIVLDSIGTEAADRRFAIIIDEAHSSQGGRTAAAMNSTLSGTSSEDDEGKTFEDHVIEIMESRKMLPNASYFAFTATPKNKTLEMFGVPFDDGGKVKHRPFHSYTMRQAIEERFILDVLESYTPVESYYRLVKTVGVEPEFDKKKATKKLRKYVEGHEHAIRAKAEIMVDHFHEQVLALNKIGGQARAMVVTSGIERAIQYYHAIRDYLQERKSPYRAIVAFSGEHEWGGKQETESSLNGFASNAIASKVKEDPYRFLVCADKFQTGYDEPLLHTMYVDKPLSGIKAVQTLSRLNRAYPKKHDVFVLDFINDVETVRESFAPYYRTTVLSDETDANKLHDLKAALDGAQVYTPEQVDELVRRYLSGDDRDKLDPSLDVCVVAYSDLLDEDGQVSFKGKAKVFIRTYAFLASILPYTNAEWEKLSIFLNFLVPKLPAPMEEDLARGILETIDMDSYRAEKQATQKIQLEGAIEIDPPPTDGGGYKSEPELETLSSILRDFNDHFGNIAWADQDRVRELITQGIPALVSADTAYQNAVQNSDEQNARVEHGKALERVMTGLLKDDTELFKQFSDNDSFKQWLTGAIFAMTYRKS